MTKDSHFPESLPDGCQSAQRDLEVPVGWSLARFGDIYELSYGRGLPKSARNTDGKYPVYGANGVIGYHDLYLVDGPVIVVGRKGTAGAVWFSLEPCWPIDTTYYVCDSDHIDIRFSFHLFTSLRLNQFDRSTAIPGLNRNDVYELAVHLPPLPEQRRIVAKVDELFSTLDHGLDNLKKARAQLDDFRQALLNHAFKGKLTAQWRADNKVRLETREQLLAHVKRKRSEHYEQQLRQWKETVEAWQESGRVGRTPARPRRPKSLPKLPERERSIRSALPDSWLWLPAETVGAVQLGRQRSPKNRSNNHPTKYIRAANITESGLDLSDVLDMDFVPHERATYRLEKGDIVLSEASGSATQVGKPAIWDDQIPNCCFQNTVIRHRPYCREFSVYLLWLYRFYYLGGRFAEVAGGVGINHLSASKFAQITIPLCPLAEQQEIVRLLERGFTALGQQAREIDSALKQADALRQAILKKALSGRLVAQDPNDEPASVLLDRIRAEREQTEKRNARRRAGKRPESKKAV